MRHRIIGRILEPLGLYGINQDFMSPVQKQLDTLDTEFVAVMEGIDGLKHIIDALQVEEESLAIALALDYLHIDENSEQLLAIREQTRWSPSLESVLENALVTKTLHEIVRLLSREAQLISQAVQTIFDDVNDLANALSEKLMQLPVEAASWNISERLGTPEALEQIQLAIAELKDGAYQAQARIISLKREIECLIVH